MRMGLGIGLGIAHSGARPYAFTNAEAAALVARFTTPPTDARKKLIDTLIGSLKTAGVWAKLDALYVMAAADSQAARRNWIQDAYNLTAVNAPTFTADRGYTGDGASTYLDTGFNPTTASSPKWSLNAATLGLYIRTDVAEDKADIGQSTQSRIDTHRVSGMIYRINNSNNISMGQTGAVGFWIANRTGASATSIRKNGASASTSTEAATTMQNSNIVVLSNAVTFSSKQTAVALIGALSDTQADAAYSPILTYLTAIGAN